MDDMYLLNPDTILALGEEGKLRDLSGLRCRGRRRPGQRQRPPATSGWPQPGFRSHSPETPGTASDLTVAMAEEALGTTMVYRTYTAEDYQDKTYDEVCLDRARNNSWPFPQDASDRAASAARQAEIHLQFFMTLQQAFLSQRGNFNGAFGN